MNKQLILIFVVMTVTYPISSFAQNNLCQGAYWTELEAEKMMMEFSGQWSDRAGWEARAGVIREGIIQGLGWNKIPEYSASLNPVIHSRRVMDGYIVENISIESFPGFFLTGNLYRPAQGTG